jgi:hypothetical protein
MNAFLNLFRRNWGLKLLALILSLVVYYSMRDSAGNSNVTNNPFLKGASNGGNSK